jgi:hypothetical protein
MASKVSLLSGYGLVGPTYNTSLVEGRDTKLTIGTTYWTMFKLMTTVGKNHCGMESVVAWIACPQVGPVATCEPSCPIIVSLLYHRREELLISSSWWWHFFADQQARVTACSVKEGKLDEGQEPLVEWLQRLWVPALVLLTVATGYQYPFSLFVTLVFLMWSTKPTPLSIYVWVEKVQQPHLSFLFYFWNDGSFIQFRLSELESLMGHPKLSVSPCRRFFSRSLLNICCVWLACAEEIEASLWKAKLGLSQGQGKLTFHQTSGYLSWKFQPVLRILWLPFSWLQTVYVFISELK